MNLREIPIEQIKPAPYNPRIPLKPDSPEYRRLKRSLNEFELVQPLIWNEKTGHIVGGHQRFEILKTDGVKTIPCVVVQLSDQKERALNITLNNQNVGSDWDIDKLTDLLSELADLPEFDPTLTGFDQKQLNDLLYTPDPHPKVLEEEPQADVTLTLELTRTDWQKLQPDFDQLILKHNLHPHLRYAPTSS